MSLIAYHIIGHIEYLNVILKYKAGYNILHLKRSYAKSVGKLCVTTSGL